MVDMSRTDEYGVKHSQRAPAFNFTYVYVHGKKYGMIKINKYLQEKLTASSSASRLVAAKLAPMLVPPKPWTSWEEGGYWYTREEIMRAKKSLEQRVLLKEASDSRNIDEIFEGLNILGGTCWTINQKLFDIVVKVWNSGKALADIPPVESQLSYPEEPKREPWDLQSHVAWVAQCKRASRLMQGIHSQRCDINYKLEIARAVIELLLPRLIVVHWKTAVFSA
jgi:DNA-directed RNA polymerase, mitochondrial